MDPQSLSFTPQSDVWRLSNTMRNFQDVQQDHADRLVRLERRQDDDSRLKSVWGPASPFPGVLSGTPQHGKSILLVVIATFITIVVIQGPSVNPLASILPISMTTTAITWSGVYILIPTMNPDASV